MDDGIDQAYRERIRALPCVVGDRHCEGPIHACHYRHRGMGSKPVPDQGNLWPGCMIHHDQSHAMGQPSFEFLYSLDLEALCRRLENEIVHGVTFPDLPYGIEHGGITMDLGATLKTGKGDPP